MEHECGQPCTLEALKTWHLDARRLKPAERGRALYSSFSDVQSVKLSRRSCMMSVESLEDSSSRVSSSAIAL